MKLRKVKRRRRPVDPAPVESLVKNCPIETCRHPVYQHNQFGCLMQHDLGEGNMEPCVCLIPREELESE